MYCTSCGVELPENTAFCTECGTPQNSAADLAKSKQLPAMQPVRREKKSVVAPFVCAILSLTVLRGVAGIVLSIIALKSSKKLLKSGCPDSACDMANATKILSIVGLVANIVTIVSIVLYFVMIIAENVFFTGGFFDGFINNFPTI